MWGLRCELERRYHTESCFLTLTYSDENLPHSGTLVKRDLQLFFKRLRKNTGANIRYYACGEYGEKYERPHYHVCLFGYRPTDGMYHSRNSKGHALYSSATMQEIWKNGYAIFGDLELDSAIYTAGYCTKVVYGVEAKAHYGSRIREFSLSSKRPAIGRRFFDNHIDEYLERGYISLRGGMKVGLPPYFINLLSEAKRKELKEKLAAFRVRQNGLIQWPESQKNAFARKYTTEQAFERKKGTL